jgi:hypothetical protein
MAAYRFGGCLLDLEARELRDSRVYRFARDH